MNSDTIKALDLDLQAIGNAIAVTTANAALLPRLLQSLIANVQTLVNRCEALETELQELKDAVDKGAAKC